MESERRLGREAAATRSQRDSAAKEAIALPASLFKPKG
jgi:hypothetical protein